MKTVNLQSLIEIYKKNEKKLLSKSFEKYIGTNIKEIDLATLDVLLETLKSFSPNFFLKDLDGFYISYNIPQIGKEFDLLRLTPSKILNIEYKSEFTKNIKLQLQKNYYYLKFLNKEIYSYTFVSNTKKLYKLDNQKNLIEAKMSELINILKLQGEGEDYYIDDLNKKFIPSNYLISPFSKTNEFINNEYFLTQRQEEIKNNIDKEIKNGIEYFVISGEAGSGKTLLTYDISKSLITQGKNVGIIHCGQLNTGHILLKENFGWNIVPIKNWKELFYNNTPKIIIIDEFQRINKTQFSEILNDYIKPNNVVLILCGDGKQILKSDEGEVFEIFEGKTFNNVKKYTLNTKIRTNKELADFIKVMLNLNKKETLKTKFSTDNITITYFDTIEEAHNYISNKKEYNYISYTPSLYYNNSYADSACKNPQRIGNAHEVIGQEFENVIAILGEQFYYGEDNKLKDTKMSGIPYKTGKMFFQQITRAINKIEIVVVNNINVFNKIIGIFD